MNRVFRYGGRVVGKLAGGTFKKTVSKQKHLMKVNDSWGIQDSILKELPDETRIEIFEKDDGILYRTNAKFWRENCTYLSFQNYGLQSFLRLDLFTIEKPTASNLINASWN